MYYTLFYNNPEGTEFIIKDYAKNIKINIMTKDELYLSCAEHLNVVDFFITDDNSGRQKWIIEEEDGVFYIKTAFNRQLHNIYLGCPNINNRVYMYTSKTKFCKWNITKSSDNIYSIKYIGEKFNKNAVEVVIARFNENIEWAEAYFDIATIYNKGPDISGNNVRKLPNVGREGHTYLHHISNEYERLADHTFFIQGDPFPHNERILFGIDNYEKCDDVQALGIRWKREANVPPISIENKYITKTDYGLHYLIMQLDTNLDYDHDYYFLDHGIKGILATYKKQFPRINSISEHFLRRSCFPIIIPKSLDIIPFTFSALFAVRKNIILKYNKIVYLNLIKELIMFHANGGTNGYILERLWLYIFTCHEWHE